MSNVNETFKTYQDFANKAFAGYDRLFIAVGNIAWNARQPEIDALKAEVEKTKSMLRALSAKAEIGDLGINTNSTYDLISQINKYLSEQP